MAYGAIKCFTKMLFSHFKTRGRTLFLTIDASELSKEFLEGQKVFGFHPPQSGWDIHITCMCIQRL